MLSVLSTDIRNDLPLLKKQQDQLFHKQDQIHCTLAGETPVSKTSGFRSPSSSSVLAWSSVPGKPPSQCTPNHQHYTSVTGDTLQHGEPSRSVVEESSDYLYDLSSLFSEEPYQSSLSDVPCARTDLGTLLADSMSEPLPTQIQTSAYQPSTFSQQRSFERVDYPHSEPLVSGSRCQPLMQQPMSSRMLSSGQVPLSTQSVALPVGNPTTVEMPPRKKARLDIRPDDSGHSSSLRDPQVVVKKYADLANVADMGKLACMLARQSYFGDDILVQLTVLAKNKCILLTSVYKST